METVRLSDDPTLVDALLRLLREYLLLPDGWESIGPVPDELPDILVTEIDRFPGPAAPPSGEVVAATVRSAPVGMGEVVGLDGGTCELKRVYVVAEHQGSGVGKVLAQALIDEAAMLGYRRAVVDVVPSRRRARALWTSIGFHEIEPYRSYPFPMVFMGRPLTTAGAPAAD